MKRVAAVWSSFSRNSALIQARRDVLETQKALENTKTELKEKKYSTVVSLGGLCLTLLALWCDRREERKARTSAYLIDSMNELKNIYANEEEARLVDEVSRILRANAYLFQTTSACESKMAKFCFTCPSTHEAIVFPEDVVLALSPRAVKPDSKHFWQELTLGKPGRVPAQIDEIERKFSRVLVLLARMEAFAERHEKLRELLPKKHLRRLPDLLDMFPEEIKTLALSLSCSTSKYKERMENKAFLVAGVHRYAQELKGTTGKKAIKFIQRVDSTFKPLSWTEQMDEDAKSKFDKRRSWF